MSIRLSKKHEMRHRWPFCGMPPFHLQIVSLEKGNTPAPEFPQNELVMVQCMLLIKDTTQWIYVTCVLHSHLCKLWLSQSLSASGLGIQLPWQAEAITTTTINRGHSNFQMLIKCRSNTQPTEKIHEYMCTRQEVSRLLEQATQAAN